MKFKKRLLFAICASISYQNIYAYPEYNESYNPTIHYDPRYLYEYRTGITGNYTYNYDVQGMYDDVTGNCDMTGKYGSCTIMDSSGNEVSAEAEWIRYGVMEVTDDDGNSYDMEAQ